MAVLARVGKHGKRNVEEAQAGSCAWCAWDILSLLNGEKSHWRHFFNGFLHQRHWNWPKSHGFTMVHHGSPHWRLRTFAEILGILGIACGTGAAGAAIRPYRYGCAAAAAPLPSHPSSSPRIELLDAGIQQMAGLSSLNFFGCVWE